ncbi:hypothetical protein YQE_08663, partial [Dendroctonus ponderosae]
MNVLKRCICSNLAKQTISRFYSGSLYEPSYLEEMRPKVSLYDTLNIQLRGYDYPVPILFRVIETTLLVGVTANVVPHEEYHEEDRYIPDSELNKLKYELEEMGGPLKKK